jgi:hypothetical protein
VAIVPEARREGKPKVLCFGRLTSKQMYR